MLAVPRPDAHLTLAEASGPADLRPREHFIDLTQIRTGLAAHGAPTRGQRYPSELRAGIRAHIRTARASGQSCASLSRELGMRTVTLQRWAEPQATVLPDWPARLDTDVNYSAESAGATGRWRGALTFRRH